MSIVFSAKGHPHVRASHRTTIEFTKDNHLTIQGDCILGIDADFSFAALRPLLKNKAISIILKVGSYSEIIHAEPNPSFSSRTELVIRKSSFLSDRTFAIHADKSCADLNQEFRQLMKDPNSTLFITIQ